MKELEHLLNWRMYRSYSRGLMAELGSHQIDVTNWFTGNAPDRGRRDRRPGLV